MINSFTICLQTYFSLFHCIPQLKISGLSRLSGVLSSAIPVDQDVFIWKEFWFIQRERKRNCRASPGSSRKFGWRVVGVEWLWLWVVVSTVHPKSTPEPETIKSMSTQTTKSQQISFSISILTSVFGLVVEVLVVVLFIMGVKESWLIVVVDIVV